MNKQYVTLTLFLLLGYLYSPITIANSSVANTPIEQSDYESIHQGIIDVSATIFDAPCNLHIDVEGRLRLTSCGAGSAFSQMNAFNIAAKTPASIQFYDIYRKQFFSSNMIKLRNGDNVINTPVEYNRSNTYRLEVRYE